MYGRLVCMNIMQDMIDFDKKGFMESIGDEVWEAVCDGRALIDPERHLSRFGLLVYADLKKYKYTYWFTFPALNYPKDVFYNGLPGQQSITEYFNNEAIQMFQEQCDSSVRSFQKGYFIVLHDKQSNQIKCISLDQYSQAIETLPEQKIYFAFSDPCPNNQYPGWPLRNFLALITVQFQLDNISIIRVRRGQPTPDHKSEYHHSLVLNVNSKLDDSYKHFSLKGEKPTVQRPIVTGWEKNESQQMAPKRVNLSNLLDPIKLAADAVNLNLKLMKWRLLPGLDLEIIANTKCLILGCGTLGCHIARGLLAWGVKHIAFIDNSRVSYANPVRQTLYTFDDCSNRNTSESGRGSYKAEAAAASLRKIHPTVDVEAHVLSIPMPGHHVVQNDVEQTKKDVEKIEQLIEDHDVVFLLMDTRESRWLPTVIAMSRQKLVINAAIGFDTFLLQRFGIREYSLTSIQEQREQQPSTSMPSKNNQQYLESDKLGCYFCNDIVAPGDSTLDRTLDQQCTVSRPGVSMMVSAMAVEFLASIVSSPRGSQTPAPLDIQNDPSMINDEDLASELGIVPHSIRGNMNRYHIYMPTSPCFNKCSACSPAVINSYREHGFEFLYNVFNEPSYLEEIAGLKDLKNVNDDVWALDSDEMSTDDCVAD